MKKSLALASLVLFLSSSQLMYGSEKKKEEKKGEKTKGLLEVVMERSNQIVEKAMDYPKTILGLDVLTTAFAQFSISDATMPKDTAVGASMIGTLTYAWYKGKQYKSDKNLGELPQALRDKEKKGLLETMSRWDVVYLLGKMGLTFIGTKKQLDKRYDSNKGVTWGGAMIVSLSNGLTTLVDYKRDFRAQAVQRGLKEWHRRKEASGALAEGVSLETLETNIMKNAQDLKALRVRRENAAIAREKQHEEDMAKKDKEIKEKDAQILELLRKKK